MKQYDAIVIGAGNGGLAAAATLAKGGKKVALFEKTVLREALPRPSGGDGSILRCLCMSCAVSAEIKTAPAA